MLAGAGAPVLVAKQEGVAMKTEQVVLDVQCMLCCFSLVSHCISCRAKGQKVPNQTWGLVSEGFRVEHA